MSCLFVCDLMILLLLINENVYIILYGLNGVIRKFYFVLDVFVHLAHIKEIQLSLLLQESRLNDSVNILSVTNNRKTNIIFYKRK